MQLTSLFLRWASFLLVLDVATSLKCRTGDQQMDEQLQNIMKKCRQRVFNGSNKSGNENSAPMDKNDSYGEDSSDSDESFYTGGGSSAFGGNTSVNPTRRLNSSNNGNVNGNSRRFGKNSESQSSYSHNRTDAGRKNVGGTASQNDNRAAAATGMMSDRNSGSGAQNDRNNGDGSRRDKNFGNGPSTERHFFDGSYRNDRNFGKGIRNDRNFGNTSIYEGGNSDGMTYMGQGTAGNDQQDQACAVQCFFDELKLVDRQGFPDKMAVIRIMTRNIRNRELYDFIQEAVNNCFYIVSKEGNKEPCKSSQSLLNCLANKGRERCEDWDSR